MQNSSKKYKIAVKRNFIAISKAPGASIRKNSVSFFSAIHLKNDYINDYDYWSLLVDFHTLKLQTFNMISLKHNLIWKFHESRTNSLI